MVGGAGAFSDGQAGGVSGNVFFLRVNKRAYKRHARAVHIAYRRKRGKPPFVKQRQKHSFHKVVGVVPQRKFVAIKGFKHSVQRSAPHFGAKRAGIFFLSHVEYYGTYVRFFYVVRNAFFAAELFKRGKIHVSQPHVDGYGKKFERLGREFPVSA